MAGSLFVLVATIPETIGAFASLAAGRQGDNLRANVASLLHGTDEAGSLILSGDEDNLDTLVTVEQALEEGLAC